MVVREAEEMTQREQLQREIAAMLDHPSVYMGGPSARNMALAERIMRHLAKSTTNLLDEIERLQVHKRAQAEDIITLGQMVGKLEAEIERLRVALKDCSESLAEEVEARFNAVKRHPSMQRQYDRDMTPVTQALKLLGD